MQRAVAVFLAGVCGYCTSASADTALRVLTYNIHHGEGVDGVLDLDRIAGIIRASEAQVVCLQEVDRNLPRTKNMDFPVLLAEKLGMQVVFEPNYQFDGGDYGNATLTSLEITGTENTRLPNPPGREPRGCLRVTVRFEGGEVDVFNTHLGLDAQERAQQAEAIVEKLRETPAILAGDMNEGPSGAALKQFLERLANPSDPTTKTSPSEHPLRQIDFILASKHFDVLSSRVLAAPGTTEASDHLPYMAELRLKTP